MQMQNRQITCPLALESKSCPLPRHCSFEMSLRAMSSVFGVSDTIKRAPDDFFFFKSYNGRVIDRLVLAIYNGLQATDARKPNTNIPLWPIKAPDNACVCVEWTKNVRTELRGKRPPSDLSGEPPFSNPRQGHS